MWHGFDPQIRQQLVGIREMVARRHQTPTKEWPLIFIEEHDVLFVMREWPDGAVTAYATSEYSDLIRQERGTAES
jgi:hypothetical protein